MKRHDFAGQPASHGAHRVHRTPGAIGQCATPSRVFKGMRMAGRMGGEQVTTLNLEVVQADAERRSSWSGARFPAPGVAWSSSATRSRPVSPREVQPDA